MDLESVPERDPERSAIFWRVLEEASGDPLGDQLELAWAAGFFEGEGCVSAATPRKRLRIRAAVTQNGDHAPELLRRFVSAVGQGNVLGPYTYAGSLGKKPRYVVQYQTEESVAALMRVLDPFLSPGSPKRSRYIELTNSLEAQAK